MDFISEAPASQIVMSDFDCHCCPQTGPCPCVGVSSSWLLSRTGYLEMARIDLDEPLLATLKDKVVVVTGGSNGIGKAGARIVLGHISTERGLELESKLNSPNVCFVLCDVSSYQDQLALFATAKCRFGHVDIIIANADITIAKDPFTPGANLEQEPSMKELDVNLKRAFFTERTGIAYLRENDGVDLILVSSIAGFKESPALTPYLASKHRIIGILRGIRLTAIKGSIRASTICPRMTSESLKTSVLVISTKADVMADAETVMVKGVQKDWEELKLPTNELSEVVNSFLICATPNRGSSGSSHPGAKLHSHGASYTRRAVSHTR
ncbi:hypothetical protein EDD37DRAFT_610034 [Exophiala viscosa]|uniref:uncharacterized protein n=1 Tax=Exophiala viscosa TaxID=2486360 RepID=UPI0021A1EF1D|nr:hypothetical protein EDD37DRAFT_610034 [Exophiala viscosa]